VTDINDGAMGNVFSIPVSDVGGVTSVNVTEWNGRVERGDMQTTSRQGALYDGVVLKIPVSRPSFRFFYVRLCFGGIV
jgi:hypothetical protein